MGGGGRSDTRRDKQFGAVYNGAHRPIRYRKEPRRGAGSLTPQLFSVWRLRDADKRLFFEIQTNYQDVRITLLDLYISLMTPRSVEIRDGWHITCKSIAGLCLAYLIPNN